MRSKQVTNPILPSYEYMAGAKVRVFDERVYIYGAHDKFNSKKGGTLDFVCWSAPVTDLHALEFHGVIYKKKQDKKLGFFKSNKILSAPDVIQGLDGKFYLYYTVDYASRVAVAVCDTPAGEYQFLDYVHHEDGTLLGKKNEPLLYDPSVFLDSDGRVYLYAGFAPLRRPRGTGGKRLCEDGCMAIPLNADMVTASGDIHYICATKKNSMGTGFEGHEFYRSPSMRKFNGRYYFTYTSTLGYEICCAVSGKPTEGFHFAGTLLALGDMGLDENKKPNSYIGETQGCLVKLKYKYFIFYHRHTNRCQTNRQICAEELKYIGGQFTQAEVTSCGLNGKPLRGIGTYKAKIACNLFSRWGARTYPKNGKMIKGVHPYFTQSGKDRNHTPSQHIAHFNHGSTVGFKYFEFDGANQIIVTIKGNPHGKLIVSETPNGRAIAKIRLTPSPDLTDFYSPLFIEKGKRALYFTYEGMGSFIFKGFKLQQVTRGHRD